MKIAIVCKRLDKEKDLLAASVFIERNAKHHFKFKKLDVDSDSFTITYSTTIINLIKVMREFTQSSLTLTKGKLYFKFR